MTAELHPFIYGTNSTNSELFRSAAAPPQAGRQLSYDSQSSIASDVDQTPAFTYGIKSDLVRSAAAPPQAGRQLSYDSQSSIASDVDQTPAFTYGIKSDLVRSAAAPPQAGRLLSHDSQSSCASDVDQTTSFTYGIKSDSSRSAATPAQAGTPCDSGGVQAHSLGQQPRAGTQDSQNSAASARSEDSLDQDIISPEQKDLTFKARSEVEHDRFRALLASNRPPGEETIMMVIMTFRLGHTTGICQVRTAHPGRQLKLLNHFDGMFFRFMCSELKARDSEMKEMYRTIANARVEAATSSFHLRNGIYLPPSKPIESSAMLQPSNKGDDWPSTSPPQRSTSRLQVKIRISASELGAIPEYAQIEASPNDDERETGNPFAKVEQPIDGTSSESSSEECRSAAFLLIEEERERLKVSDSPRSSLQTGTGTSSLGMASQGGLSDQEQSVHQLPKQLLPNQPELHEPLQQQEQQEQLQPEEQQPLTQPQQQNMSIIPATGSAVTPADAEAAIKICQLLQKSERATNVQDAPSEDTVNSNAFLRGLRYMRRCCHRSS
eukprot:TRINITY_DN13186_c0_g1_i5.p1 TRINITY_DN13186_c0_g1~~TRINITY_DN13186_c0_g1_i5.p1  ORF type:complete len:620 (+),score=91.98 TRINITY_DN13186_c0_g1_i5:212-1861(+)